MWSKIEENVLTYIAVIFVVEAANKAPQPPVESTLLRQEDVETLVGLIRDIRYDLSMQVRPYTFHGVMKNDNDEDDDDDDNATMIDTNCTKARTTQWTMYTTMKQKA